MRKTLVAAVVLVLAAVGFYAYPNSEKEEAKAPLAPFQVTIPQWEQILIGDKARDTETYKKLAQVHPGLTPQQAAEAGELAVQIVIAELSGQNRESWKGYWPPSSTTGVASPIRCINVAPLAASPAAFEVINQAPQEQFVKVLVPYAATCGDTKYTAASPGVEYVYLIKENNEAYKVIREWNIPQKDPEPTADEGVPSWQLAALGPCGQTAGTTYQARTLVAAAFAQMCQAALEDDVVLVVAGGYRTFAQQKQLFDQAVEYYGSVDEALKWVAFSDGKTCSSKHCQGLAVNIEPDYAATTWLNTIARCSVVVNGKIQLTDVVDGKCQQGTAIRRSQLYGFVAPSPKIPGYLEFVLPTGEDEINLPDCSPAGVSVDKMVASIFRCRLSRAGVPPVEIEKVVAEALVVSRCASQWNAGALVYAGKYASEPNPQDGRLYTEAGVFALRRELSDTGWLQGPVLDPIFNINAAASLWLATRGWEQFACATGTDPGLRAGPVLPQYGGPALPAWTKQY